MSIDELENNQEIYHFFLSELKGLSDKDVAYLTEIARASQHMKDIHKMTLGVGVNEDTLSEGEKMLFWHYNDSLITLLFNISAAQLREALKLFLDFSHTSAFEKICKNIPANKSRSIKKIISLGNQYEQGVGLIREVLIPIRNLMFHYEPKKAVGWVREVKKLEGDRKPQWQSVKVESYDFTMGKQYDSSIYSNYLFFGLGGMDSFMKVQKEVWDIQMAFLDASGLVIEEVLRMEKIPERKWGWFMDFFHGYKDEGAKDEE